MKPLAALNSFRSHRRRGAALLLSLWALFLLSAMVISWAVNIDARLTQNGNGTRLLEAEAMACSGSEIALHPAVNAGSPLLHGGFGHGESYDTRITGEGGRLNVNWIVAGENPARLELLRHYLEVKGIDLNERDHMIDCLLDWVDPDNLVRLNGAEDEGDYHPENALLARVDDLKRVRGWEEFAARPDWDAELTVNSTGPIDLAWASRDLLLSLPGMTDQLVDQFIAFRAGPDGVEGTEDDAVFKNLDEVRVALGFSTEQFKQIAPLVSFKDQVVRIVSVGHSGNATRTVQMIVRKAGTIPQLISWKEL
ncbi:MAG: general secretion pathway protein GspK [Verrucomicrobiota bacterium]|nr:general secretion pathway protein GspK [Verrucomicrobiota bacterium]